MARTKAQTKKTAVKTRKPVSKKKVAKTLSAKSPARPSGAAKKTSARKKTETTKPKIKGVSMKRVAVKKTSPAKKIASVKKKVTAVKPSPEKPAGRKTEEVRKVTGKATDKMQELRKFLLSKKDQILKEAKEEIAKYVSGENKQLVDTALDDGDWAMVDISEDINLQRLSAHRKMLHDIDEAIRKIADGSYGVCEECGEEISEKRLKVLPTANFCVDCQENRERFESLEPVE